MATSVDGLIGLFRDRTDDNTLPQLWGDERIVEWFDEAQREFARITHLFKDTTTLVITADDPYVVVPDEFLEFRTGRIGSSNAKVSNYNMNELEQARSHDVYGDGSVSDWMTATGTPNTIAFDVISGKGRLVPIPDADDTLVMYYTRYPLKSITASSSKTELIKPEHQKSLVVYAMAQAYNDQDSDVFNSKKYDRYIAEFYRDAEKFAMQIKNSTHRAGTVRYGGY